MAKLARRLFLGNRKRLRWASIPLCALFATGMVFMLSSCRYTDELIEVIYDQESEIVDYDNEEKNYAFSEDAEETSEYVEVNYTDYDEEDLDHVEATVPVFGNPPNTTDPVEQVLYDATTGLDRSAPIFNQDPQEDESDDTDDEDDDNAGEGTLYDPNAVNGGLSDGGSDEGEGEGESNGDAGANESENSDNGVAESSAKVYNQSGGMLETLDEVATVATVGEWANLAMMLGGPGTLVASDTGFLNSSGAQTVYSAEGWAFSSISSAWTYDEEADTYTLDFDALLAADPDLVWVPDGVDLLTEEQQQTLLDAGVYVESAPSMSSSTNIEEMALWLGGSLSGGSGTVSGWDALERAETYVYDYLGDDIDALIDENGGLTTYNGIDYSGQGQSSTSETTWTLFVTEWDSTATFSASNLTPSWTSTGIAIARSGYGWSPVNYYLSVGGVNNNAAQFPTASVAATESHNYYVWQFNMGMLDPLHVTNATLGVTSFSASGTEAYSLSMNLTGAPARSVGGITSSQAFETSLGASDFYYIICANQSITDSMKAARDSGTTSQTGLYAAYNYTTGTGGSASGVGPRYSYGGLIPSVIGTYGAERGDTMSIGEYNAAQGKEVYGVVTAANGLYCDWISGSVESFLMAFWIDDFYDTVDSGTIDYTNFLTEAANFYAYFYGYSLTEDDMIQLYSGRES